MIIKTYRLEDCSRMYSKLYSELDTKSTELCCSYKQRQKKAIVVLCVSLLCLVILGILFLVLSIIQTSDGEIVDHDPGSE